MDRACAATVDLGFIPIQVEPKTIKLLFIASLFDVQLQKRECEASTACGRQIAARLKDRKIPSLSPGQGTW